MAARKRWRRYIPDDEISVRAFLHLIGRLFYYVGLHSEYFLLNFGRGARAAVLALWHGVCWMLALGANILRPFFAAVWEDLRAPWRQMRSGLRNIRQVVREEREAGGSPAGKGLAYFFRGVWRTSTCSCAVWRICCLRPRWASARYRGRCSVLYFCTAGGIPRRIRGLHCQRKRL